MADRLTQIKMIVSYGGDYVAGEVYELPADEADKLIVRGYAKGKLSRDYSQPERVGLTMNSQVVNVTTGQTFKGAGI